MPTRLVMPSIYPAVSTDTHPVVADPINFASNTDTANIRKAIYPCADLYVCAQITCHWIPSAAWSMSTRSSWSVTQEHINVLLYVGVRVCMAEVVHVSVLWVLTPMLQRKILLWFLEKKELCPDIYRNEQKILIGCRVNPWYSATCFSLQFMAVYRGWR